MYRFEIFGWSRLGCTVLQYKAHKIENGRQHSRQEYVLLSIRGALFRHRSEDIRTTDWVLSKILTSHVPWSRTADGQFYVDVDPDSFLLILSIRSGLLDLEQEASKLSGAELVLLKATARYLMLDNIVRQVDCIATGHAKVVSELEFRRIMCPEIQSVRIKGNQVQT